MTKHQTLAYGAALPAPFLDALQELLGTYMSPNMSLSVLNATTVQLAGSTDNGQVALSINGSWRYNATSVTATHPGGAAGIYALWATGSANAFAVGPPEVDTTSYAFALEIRASGTPSTAISRQIGYVEWNGSAITRANLLLDDSALRGTAEPGDYIFSASASRAGALLADGSSQLRASFPALFQSLGGTSSPYGLPDGTHFNVPDCRGRLLMCAGSGVGLTVRVIGTNGGVETVTLSAAQSGVPAHTHPSGGAASGTTGTGTTGTGTSGTGTTGTGTSGNDSPDHVHAESTALAIPNTGALAPGTGSFDTALPSPGGINTGGASTRHQHSVPGLSVPGLSIPGLSIPSLSASVTDPSTPANSAAAAGASHDNMPPWFSAYVFVKT